MVVQNLEEQKPPFSILEFQKNLQQDSAIDHIKDFIKRARDPDDVDVVREFVEKATKNDCSKMINLINPDRTPSELTTIFEALQEIFIRIATDLKDFSPWALPMIRQLLQGDVLKQVNRGLSFGNTSNEIINTLKYLTSMVMSSPQAAKEVFTQFKFNRDLLLRLLTRVNMKIVKDVRACVIDFLLSFIMSGNSSLKRQVLNTKDLLSDVFQGLPSDKFSTIETFLSSVTTQVVEDKNIPKTIKVHFLKHQTVAYVFQLFKWKGPKPFQKEFQKKGLRLTQAEKEAGGEVTKISPEEEVEAVHQLAEEFIVSVCCSHRLGIVFNDPHMGTGRNVNYNIFNLLHNLEKPFTKPRLEFTFAEIFKACPDQIVLYFTGLKSGLHPRESAQWFSTMSFISRVLSSLDLIKIIDVMDTAAALPKLLQMFLNVCCTPALSSGFLQEIIRNNSLSIRHHGAYYVEVVLTQMKKLSDEKNKEAKHLKLKISRFQDFKTKFCLRIFKLLPPPEDFIFCWDLACGSVVGSLDAELSEDVLRGFSLFEHLKVLVNCLSIYLEFMPDASEFSSGNLAGLLLNLESLKDRLQPEEYVDLQLRLLKHLGDNAGGKCLFLELIKGTKSVSSILFEILLKTKDAAARRMTIDLMKQLLLSTGAFTSNENELDLWLRQLLLKVDESEDLATFFKDICDAIAGDPKQFVDATNAFILEAEGSSTDDEELVYIKIFDEILVENDSDDHTDFKIFGEGTFSPLINVAIHLLETKKYSDESTDVYKEFLSAVVFDLICTRRNPNPLLLFLQQNMELFSTEMAAFLKSLKEHPKSKSTKKKHTNFTGFNSNFSYLYKLDEENVHETVNGLEIAETFLLSQEILTYFHFLKERKGDTGDLMENYCQILHKVMDRNVDGNVDAFPFFCQSIAEHILRRPVIQRSFLNEDLCLSKLAISALNREENLISSVKHIYQNKVEEFIFEKLDCVDADLCLNEIVEPFAVELSNETVICLISKLSQLTTRQLVNKKGKKLSDTGILLTKLLDRASQLPSFSPNSVLPASVFCQCFNIYIQMGFTTAAGTLGDCLMNIMDKNLIYCAAVSEDIFLQLLKQLDFSHSVKLVQILSKNLKDHMSNLCKYLLNLDEFQGPIVPLVLTYLKAVDNSSNGHKLIKKLRKYFWPLIITSLTAENDSEIPLELDHVESMLQGFSKAANIGNDDLLEFCNQFKSSNFDSSLAARLLQSSKWIYERLSENSASVNNYNAIAMFSLQYIQSILASLSKSEDGDDETKSKTASDIKYIIDFLENVEVVPDLGRAVHQEKVWHRLIKITLKFGLRDKHGSLVLKLLVTILKKLKVNKELWSIHCTSILQLIVGHSNFVPGILNTSEDELEWRISVIDCLTFLVESEKSCCDSNHIPILLSAYGATLSKIDQKILYLIYLYEENEINVHSFRPFLWGPTAIGHYAIKKSLTHSLWKQPTMEEILNVLDRETVMETAFKFPLEHQLQPSVVEVPDSLTTLYDPRFLQSLLSNLLTLDSLVHCIKFIESNCLAFLLASLSSKDAAIRSAGYHNVALFYQHLEGSRYNKRSQWLYMLDCLKNSIVEENCRLPSLITVFLIRCCQLLQNPNDLMSRPIMNFLLLKPQLDIGNVPEFITLFHSGDITHHELHRNWMLAYLSLGFRSELDYDLCRKKHILKLLMTYFDSPLASINGKLLVLEFLTQVSSIPKAASKLVNRHGLFPFISSVVAQRNDSLMPLCIRLICKTWTSMNASQCAFTISETLSVLLNLLMSMSDHQPLDIFEMYLKTLDECLSAFENDKLLLLTTGGRFTTTHVTRLMELYKNIEVQGRLNSKNYESKKLVDLSADDQLRLLDSCINCVSNIVIKWTSDGNEEVFKSLSEFLFQNVHPGKNGDKLEPMYRWLEHCFMHGYTCSSSLLEHMFKCFERLLFREGSDNAALRALFSLFLVIANNKTHQTAFGSDKMREMLDDVSSEFNQLQHSDSKCVSFGVLACELFLKSETTAKFEFYRTECDVTVAKRKRKMKSEISEGSTKKKSKKKRLS